MKEESVKTLSLRQHPDYIRGQHSKTYVEELAQVILDAKGKWPFPNLSLQPIPESHDDRKDGGTYWILDGVHRGTAAALAKIPNVPAFVYSGLTQEEAIALQIQSNNSHGLRLSLSAQTNAIKRLHALGMQGKTIAEKTGLHPSSVSRILGEKQRAESKGKVESKTKEKSPAKFDADNFFKGLNRILKIWEKHGTKIRKAGLPDVCGKALDTLAGKLLYGDEAGKEN